MRIRLSSSFVKQSLSGHSWIGLLVGALMYLVCLSGALAVFYQEIQRWEQPGVEEFLQYDPEIVDQGYRNLLASGADVTHHMYVLLPTESMPRLMIESEEEGWLVNRDGSLGQPVDDAWTHLLLWLHIYLHLPESFGIVVVSALGAMLCALIVSGFLAHPRILKDAFNLRLHGSRRLEQVDIHNRLSVWGAPFHLMIAVTGAYFGLALLISAVLAQVFYDGDQDALLADVYGAELELQQAAAPPALSAALTRVKDMAPGTEPFFVTIEYADEPEKQFLIVGTKHPDRLIWAEQYRFDAAGRYVDKGGYSDGEAGLQAIYSTYRIHFGHFGGFAAKIVYGLLGLALTVVSVTGVNVWFARRKTRSWLNNLWVGCVWGTPLALAATAVTQVIFEVPSTLLFWLLIVASMAAAQLIDDDLRGKIRLQRLTAAVLALLVVAHAVRFGGDAFSGAALGVNAALLATAFIFSGLARLTRRRIRTHLPLTDRRLPA